MPRYACPNCESEDLKSVNLRTIDVDGRTVIACDYCVEDGKLVAGAAYTPPVVSMVHLLNDELREALDGWTVGPANDGAVEAGLYHSCDPEPVTWLDIEPITKALEYILGEHRCGGEVE